MLSRKFCVNKYYKTPLDVGIREGKIFHLIYSYILLNPNSYLEPINNAELLEIWKEVINLIKKASEETKIINSIKAAYLYADKVRVYDLIKQDFRLDEYEAVLPDLDKLKKYCHKSNAKETDGRLDNIFRFVIPKSCFVRNDKYFPVGLMCDYKFDPEHGIVLVYINNKLIKIGPQDIIL